MKRFLLAALAAALVTNANAQTRCNVVSAGGTTTSAATVATADNKTAPTALPVVSYPYMYDGSTWDRFQFQGIEDVAETSATGLSMCGTVRRDTAASSAGSTGDNATLNTDATGRVWTTGTQIEDVAETADGQLIMSGTVRRDAAASSAGTTGDNATLNTDATGRLWTSGAAFEDAGHTSADQGVVMLGVQQTTLTGLAGTTLDYAPMQFNAQGALYTVPTGSASLVVERIDVAATGTSVQGSSAAVKTCFVSCPGTNTSACYIRTSTGNGVTGGFAIAKGESEGPFHVQNTNLFWVDAGTNGDDVVLLCTN